MEKSKINISVQIDRKDKKKLDKKLQEQNKNLSKVLRSYILNYIGADKN